MNVTYPVLKLFIIFILLAGWVYLRIRRAGRRKGRLHGRELWRAGFRSRREERIAGAESWEQRRQRKENVHGERHIAARYLKQTDQREEDQG